MEFKLNIKLGNEAMNDGFAVADALNKVADRVAEHYMNEPASFRISRGSIYDANGNTVGSWEVAE